MGRESEQFEPWALGAVYHKNVPAISGPLIDTATVKDGAFVLTFKYPQGLSARGDLTGFELAGAGIQWQPAEAKIDSGWKGTVPV
ncbi:MAG: hypothetical protein B7Z37_03280 [Verrucomicrobia bacterium 12-59-8]|nr:MAG: hypothetical protein B7Z37_03280 [Verrucomicrobia bacterium 12-59-8]